MKSLDKSKLASVGVVAAVVIVRNGKVLLVQEAFKAFREQWNFPAGMVDIGEAIEEAAIREAKEESGFDVKLGKELLVMHQAIDRPVLHAFLAEIIGGELKFDTEEILDVKWFDVETVMHMDGLRNNDFMRGSINIALNL